VELATLNAGVFARFWYMLPRVMFGCGVTSELRPTTHYAMMELVGIEVDSVSDSV